MWQLLRDVQIILNIDYLVENLPVPIVKLWKCIVQQRKVPSHCTHLIKFIGYVSRVCISVSHQSAKFLNPQNRDYSFPFPFVPFNRK